MVNATVEAMRWILVSHRRFMLGRQLRPPQATWPAVIGWAVVLLITPPVVQADLLVSLPLHGNYRVGKFMPVRVAAQAQGSGQSLLISANGALTTEIRPDNGRIDGVAPWLSIRAVRDLEWAWGAAAGSAGAANPLNLPLRPLDDNERLIAYVGADADALASCFPGKTLVRVELDETQPLPGDVASWECLDGLVLDSGSAQRLDQQTVRRLLTAGTAVAIRSRRRPLGELPWRRSGDFWIAQWDIAGPTTAYQPDAYAPVQGWIGGQPSTLRRQVMAMGAAAALLIAGSLLWRSKWNVALSVVASLACTAAAITFAARTSVQIQTGGVIEVRNTAGADSQSAQVTGPSTNRAAAIMNPHPVDFPPLQRDRWTYLAELRAADATFAWQGGCKPLFASRSQAQTLGIRLECDGQGRPIAYAFHLKPRQSLAFVGRSTSEPDVLEKTPASMDPGSSPTPMKALVDAFYARRGDRLVGQTPPASPQDWPGVIIERP